MLAVRMMGVNGMQAAFKFGNELGTGTLYLSDIDISIGQLFEFVIQDQISHLHDRQA